MLLKYKMDYFRQKLLTYSTERQMSTLLHIYTEIDKPRKNIPMTRTQSYVDQILNDYSVKMYSYPDLSIQDNKLALNIHLLTKSNNTNNRVQDRDRLQVFHIEESKRKPAKKKIIRKSIPLTSQQIPQKVQRTCPCCQSKNVIKHRCEHTICQKPCVRLKRQRSYEDDQFRQQNRIVDEQEQFTPEKSQMDPEQSKSSNFDHESDFQEEMDMMAELSDSQSSPSSLSKNKKIKNRVRTRKQASRTRRSRQAVQNNPSRRSRRREAANNALNNTLKDQQKVEEQKVTENLQKNFRKREIQNLKELIPVKRRTVKKPQPKLNILLQNAGIESQFDPQNPPPRDFRRRRGFAIQKKIIENQEKDDSSKNKKKPDLSFFCTPQQLRQHQIFNIRIINENAKPKKNNHDNPQFLERKIQPQKDENKLAITEKQEKQEKQKQEELEEQEEQQQEEPFIIKKKEPKLEPIIDEEPIQNDDEDKVEEDPIFEGDQNDQN